MSEEMRLSCLDKNDIIVRVVRENEHLKKLLLKQDENKR